VSLPRRGLAALVAAVGLLTATGAGLGIPAGAAPQQERVTILGDSVMVDGSPGIQAILESTKAVTVTPRAFPGYGLTRANWQADFARILNDTKPTGVAILLGGWDLDAATADPAGYAATVGQAMDLLTSKGAQVAWIGELPGEPRFENEAKRRNLNTIVAAVAAKHPLVHYVSADPTFDGTDGQYAMFLPGLTGRLVRVRKVDGQHLCPDGAARLGQLVYDTLHRPLALPAPAHKWQSGAWRQDGVYTQSTSYDAKTLKLTRNVCPPR
jgi:hypothetical protein